LRRRLKRAPPDADPEAGSMSDLVAWAARFIATPSVSRDGNTRIARLAADLLREVGLEPRLDSVRDRGVMQHNLIADAGGGGDGGLLLVTHLDTVPPGDPARWTATGGDPFRPVRDADRLYGLGAADAKVDFVCKAHKGYAVYDAHLPACPSPSAPRARRVEEEVQGVAAHSSTPARGRNAIEAALERLSAESVAGVAEIEGGEEVNKVPARCRLVYYVDDPQAPPVAEPLYPARPLVAFLEAWRGLRADLEEPRDPRFEPDHSVTNLGRIRLEAGRPVVTFDLRPVPGVDPDEAVKTLREVARVVCDRFNPPLATPQHSRLLAAVCEAQEALGIGRRVATKATCTEAGVLSEAGLEALVFGAGRSVGNVHRPNEHTRISQLSLARDLYARVIRSLCGDGA
jgi:acetylornithine deacetylase/succinyl-diaminopimelate desuccinylase-like protein